MIQPIEVPATVERGMWWWQTFEHDETGYQYVAVVPTFGPAHFHRGCWCGEKVETTDDGGLELVVHQEPPN